MNTITTKEKVINEAIVRIEKRLAQIKKIEDKDPVRELIKAMEDLSKFLEENAAPEQRRTEAFRSKLEILVKRQDKHRNQAKKRTGKSQLDLMDERIKLEFELNDLLNEKWYIERTNK